MHRPVRIKPAALEVEPVFSAVSGSAILPEFGKLFQWG